MTNSAPSAKITLNAMRASLRAAPSLSPASKAFLTGRDCAWFSDADRTLGTVRGTSFHAILPGEKDEERVMVACHAIASGRRLEVTFYTRSGARSGLTTPIVAA